MRPSTGVVLPRCKVPVQVIQVPDGGDSGTPPRGGAGLPETPSPNKATVLAGGLEDALEGEPGDSEEEGDYGDEDYFVGEAFDDDEGYEDDEGFGDEGADGNAYY